MNEKKKIGKLKARYSFALNKYNDIRFSKCPRCNHNTYNRKFIFFIHLDDWGPLLLGKTCKYCSKCELIVAHKNELEEQLILFCTRYCEENIGKEYLVMGTIDKKKGKEGFSGKKLDFDDVLNHMSDFIDYIKIKYDYGGWIPPKNKST